LFSITKEPINPATLKKKVQNNEAGAFVVFEGWVRNHNEGSEVSSLEYETFESLALKEASLIIDEAKKKFEILDISAVHREGRLSVGDLAIWIGVSAKHRNDAFRACQFIIDQMKHRLPIWKKEHYINKPASWVNCQGCYHHAHIDYTEKDYYEKQLKLSNIGDKGQALLKNAKILVIGAGGLGCPALSYLTSAGVGSITIYDGDRLEISNLHRQTLYSHEDIGEYKSILAKKRLKGMNPFIQIHSQTDRINIFNAKEIISQHDLILDCTDNFETKFIIHDACYFLKKPLIQASIYQHEGQLQVFHFKNQSDCMRCIWPTIPEQGQIGNCADVGVLGVVPGILGTMQASEAIKALLHQNSIATSHTLLVDLTNWGITRIKRTNNKNCPLCSSTPSIVDLSIKNYGRLNYEIDLSDVSNPELNHYRFIDIREQSERDESHPWEKFLKPLPSNKIHHLSLHHSSERILLVCKKGIRSKKLAKKLRQSGLKNIFSLYGGVHSVQENWNKIKKGTRNVN